MSAGDQGPIALAERVLSILEQGGFSATYKFALFTAILDLCIEKTTVHGTPPESLTTRQLADNVVQLYWDHVTPYGCAGILRQGGGLGEQAEIVRRIAAARATFNDARTAHQVRRGRPREYQRLLDFVEWKLIEMPIPRLQVLGVSEDRFLYDYNWDQRIRHSTVAGYQRGTHPDFDNRLLLKPRVGEHLVRLNAVLRPLFYREWAVMVARMNRLPEAELEAFLFGAERTSLEAVRRPLRDLQENRCFYCGERMAAASDVDHFIPWARFRDDSLDNLVVAHPKCNNSKRDFLAAAEHVERWVERVTGGAQDLQTIARTAGWPRDRARSCSIAAAVYLRLPEATRLWRGPADFVPIDRDRIARVLARCAA